MQSNKCVRCIQQYHGNQPSRSHHRTNIHKILLLTLFDNLSLKAYSDQESVLRGGSSWEDPRVAKRGLRTIFWGVGKMSGDDIIFFRWTHVCSHGFPGCQAADGPSGVMTLWTFWAGQNLRPGQGHPPPTHTHRTTIRVMSRGENNTLGRFPATTSLKQLKRLWSFRKSWSTIKVNGYRRETQKSQRSTSFYGDKI